MEALLTDFQDGVLAPHAPRLVSSDTLTAISSLSRPLRESLSSALELAIHEIGANAFPQTVRLLSALLSDKKSTTPVRLCYALAALQERVRGDGSTLSQEVAKLAETAVLENRLGHEAVRGSVVKDALQRVMRSQECSEIKVTMAHVKKLCSLREAIVGEIVAGDPQVQATVTLIVTVPFIFRVSEGVRFAAEVLAAPVLPLREAIHSAIKQQLPFCRNTRAQAYGETYFRAWKALVSSQSDHESLSHFESSCIQDLMNAAIHAARKSLRDNLLILLMAFHAQKRHPGVDDLLQRLYAPLLPRFMRVANPLVRANAVRLWSDAFPLVDTGVGIDQLEADLRRELEVVLETLCDEVVGVREIAVQGACRVLSVYWDVIPATELKRILKRIIKDLAFDSSSSAVRVAAVEGVRHILKRNVLAREALKGALPRLAPLLHDRSERVRLAFLRLLLSVKEVREIRFHDIVTTDSLLIQLGKEESAQVSHSASTLLLNSFFPQSSSEPAQSRVPSQINRCVSLVRKDAAAARKFYSTLPVLCELGTICKFVKCLAKTLESNADFPGHAEHDANAQETCRETLHVILADVWQAIAKSLWKPANESLGTYMREAFDLPLLEKLIALTRTETIATSCWRVAECLALDDKQCAVSQDFAANWQQTLRNNVASGELDSAAAVISTMTYLRKDRQCEIWDFVASLLEFKDCEQHTGSRRSLRSEARKSQSSATGRPLSTDQEATSALTLARQAVLLIDKLSCDSKLLENVLHRAALSPITSALEMWIQKLLCAKQVSKEHAEISMLCLSCYCKISVMLAVRENISREVGDVVESSTTSERGLPSEIGNLVDRVSLIALSNSETSNPHLDGAVQLISKILLDCRSLRLISNDSELQHNLDRFVASQTESAVCT